ncbi:MAG: hypothetical protein Q4D21_03525 [Phascolarctobacterium sp.]|nr:hypothetical protein [Phascolarctobacterium sp.]
MSALKKYLLPGFIFQSIMVGGGYGTGAEIKEFFAVSGLTGGLMGMAVTTFVWCILCALALEFARMYRAYDYGTLMKGLLGKAGILYDICYWIMMLIVLGVVNATAGAMFNELTGMSQWLGVALLNIWAIVLLLRGTEAIENEYSFWSYLLYAVYIIFLVSVFGKFGDQISAELAKHVVGENWLNSGLQYSFYNLVVVPLFLYTARHMKTRNEALICGVISGFVAIIPGVLLLLAMGANMPEVLKAKVPVMVIFRSLDMQWLFYAFELVLFATLVETQTGFIKAVVDRVQPVMKEKYTQNIHVGLIIVLSIIGVCISAFGLIGLIVKGYGTACYGFLVLFAIPMATIGAYKIFSKPADFQIEEKK